MGALTLGIVVPSPSLNLGSRPSPATTSVEDANRPWLSEERRSSVDLMGAAQALGMGVQLLRVPSHGDPSLVSTMLAQHFGHAGLDRLIVAAHGPAGGSGKFHAAARACGLPVLGPPAEVIAAAYDKLLARQRLAFNNLPVPRTLALPHPDVSAMDRDFDRIGWPCVLKPRHGASGVGVQPIRDRSELDARLPRADHRSLEPDMLLERRVSGREVSVVVLDGELLGMIEITREFDAHGSQVRQMTCPPQLDASQRAGLANLGRRACRTLGLTRGPARVDLILSGRDNEVILEVEPLPPVHRASVVARVARAEGISYPELCARIITGAHTHSTLAPRSVAG